MANKNETSKLIRQYILTQFPAAQPLSFTDDDLLLEKGIIDSVGVLELINFIESNFSIVVSDEDLTPENFQSINNLSLFIHRSMEHV